MENTIAPQGPPSTWMCGNGVQHGTNQPCTCPAGPGGPGPKLARLAVVAAATLAMLLGGTAVASAAPAGHPEVPCSRQPSGTPGCEAELGMRVRRDHGHILEGVSNYQLGRAVQRLCFGDSVPEIEASIGEGGASRTLALNLSYLRRIKSPYCG